jgi:hypothetical protein
MMSSVGLGELKLYNQRVDMSPNPLFSPRTTVFSPGPVSGQILVGDSTRIAIYFSSPINAGSFLVGPTNPPQTFGGICFPIPGFLFLEREKIGDIVMGPWFYYQINATATVYITEILQVG